MNNQDKELLKQLGTNLRKYRLNNNISQEAFSELTQLDRTYISGLERGIRNPSFLILLRISKALDITLNDLYGDKNESNETK
jgi:transcriptional regulator with XRE-family HTH domain